MQLQTGIECHAPCLCAECLPFCCLAARVHHVAGHRHAFAAARRFLWISLLWSFWVDVLTQAGCMAAGGSIHSLLFEELQLFSCVKCACWGAGMLPQGVAQHLFWTGLLRIFLSAGYPHACLSLSQTGRVGVGPGR